MRSNFKPTRIIKYHFILPIYTNYFLSSLLTQNPWYLLVMLWYFKACFTINMAYHRYKIFPLIISYQKCFAYLIVMMAVLITEKEIKYNWNAVHLYLSLKLLKPINLFTYDHQWQFRRSRQQKKKDSTTKQL